MDQMPVLTSVVAKTLILVNAMSEDWVVVSNYLTGPGPASVLNVTPLQCGREMYFDVSWMLCAAVRWLLPHLVDLMLGLTMTSV